MAILEIPLLIGTYAKAKDVPVSGSEGKKFRWSCVVAVLEPSVRKSLHLIEKVEFRLHNSFSNVCSVFCHS